MSEMETQVNVTPPEKKSRKRIVLPLVIVLAVLALAAVAAKLAGLFERNVPGPVDPGEYVDVDTFNYYSGIIEPQKTWDIQKDASRDIAEVYVSVGDAVTTGQKLFAYDTSDTEMKLQQAQLELDGINNEIDGYASQIRELTQLRSETADEATKLGYTEQINEMEISRRQAQLNLQTQQLEIENLRKGLENAVVTSTMDGVVKQINANAGYDQTVYMTILATGSYQVKATVDELNVSSLYEGMAVQVHSRVDASRIWDGTITKIDTENTADNNQGDYFYGGGSTENQATKYYFYVSLTTSDDLLLGQHVYVEPVLDDGMIDGGAIIDDGAGDDGAVDDGTVDDGVIIDGAEDGQPQG